MKNIGFLNTSPEGLRPDSALVEQLTETPKKGADLLEVRTKDGPVYLRPTGWQLFCLQRAFRHFRVLPPQVLGSSNQRRIASLLATAVYKPDQPVTGEEVFGVVEQVHARSPKQVVPVANVFAKAPAPDPKTLTLVVQKKASPVVPSGVISPAKPAGFVVQDGSLWQWIVAGAAAAACIPLIMATVYGISALSGTPQVSANPVSTPVQQVASQPAVAMPAALPPALAAVSEKHRHRLMAGSAQPELMNASATPAGAAPILAIRVEERSV